MPGGFRQSGTRPGFKTVKLPRKTDFSSTLTSPISWGTTSIMLPPVVDFKKNLQKSYKGDIPKQNQRNLRASIDAATTYSPL
jgi:hypothetical protein